MATLFCNGCEMRDHVAGLRDSFTKTKQALKEFGEKCGAGVCKAVRASVQRGSWAVDEAEECPVGDLSRSSSFGAISGTVYVLSRINNWTHCLFSDGRYSCLTRGSTRTTTHSTPLLHRRTCLVSSHLHTFFVFFY